MSKLKCPVCKKDEFYEASYTNAICAKCGSLINNTPLGTKLIAKHKYKKEVKQWRKNEEFYNLLDRGELKIGDNNE